MRKLRHEQQPQQPNSPEPVRLPRKLLRHLSVELQREPNQDEAGELLARWRNAAGVRQVIVGVLTKELEDVIMRSEARGILDGQNALTVYACLKAEARVLRDVIDLLTTQDSK